MLIRTQIILVVDEPLCAEWQSSVCAVQDTDENDARVVVIDDHTTVRVRIVVRGTRFFEHEQHRAPHAQHDLCFLAWTNELESVLVCHVVTGACLSRLTSFDCCNATALRFYLVQI